MARKVFTVLTDDLDGGTADRTIEFSLDGVAYTIDLSDANAGALRKALDPYLSAGRRIGRGVPDGGRVTRGQTRSGSTADNRKQSSEIRAWAAKNGYEVSERGRIPVSVVEAYKGR
ncbi:Lsr2 family protein [Micromonospora sp. NPDC092111]|uniref:histone-like nucleoid-structuring protein Lsr2 n=1 Tax=Micromonospora sp. NPDC092111 TaxID=3364289 RepID=UPI00381A892B